MAHSKADQFETPYDINHVISKYGRALDYPARVLIMRWLAKEGAKKASEITTHIELAKSTTSHHLSSLEHAGLISGNETGPHISYEINWNGYRAMRHFVLAMFSELDALAPKEER